MAETRRDCEISTRARQGFYRPAGPTENATVEFIGKTRREK